MGRTSPDVVVLRTDHLNKTYPGTVAVHDLSVRFEGGKVHAIIGKNGSGKSTTIKMISGAVRPTSGAIYLHDTALVLASPRDAREAGIETVYQEPSLVPGLTVSENLLLARLPHATGFPWRIDWQRAQLLAGKMLSRLAIDIAPRAIVKDLSVAQQQLVEIARAVGSDPRVLILDEPTSALAHHEVEQLFRVIRTLTGNGITVLYISHRLQELPRIADTITVLRDGELVGRLDTEQAQPERIVSMMFGEVTHGGRPTDLTPGRRTVLEVRGLRRAGSLRDVSFDLAEGEILGIAGMLGSGRTELLRAIFGADPADGGEVVVEGVPRCERDPAVMKDHGVALIPENRATEGLVLRHSILENLTRASMGRYSSRGVRNKTAERDAARAHVVALSIRLASLDEAVATLSGGNQQKVVVGNWIGTDPRVMLFDEPTRGIDVNAKRQIFALMWELSRRGIASLFVSTELEELLEVCHRIVVLRDGAIQAELVPDNTPLDTLYALCMGDDR